MTFDSVQFFALPMIASGSCVMFYGTVRPYAVQGSNAAAAPGQHSKKELVMSDLMQSLSQKLTDAGWRVQISGQRLEADKEAISSSWFLGSRRVRHALRLDLDQASKTLSLREMATERTTGLPPPSLSFTRTTQRGLKVSETRVDSSPFGGGTLEYGAPRQWIEKECADAGWAFKLRLL